MRVFCYHGVMESGLSLGPSGIALYFGALLLWSLVLAYFIVFGFGKKAKGGHAGAHHGHGAHHPPAPHHGPAHGAGHGGGHGAHPAPPPPPPQKPFRGFSSYDGFKSFATGDTLTIEDIVKGLARESGAAALHEAEVAEDARPDHDDHPHEHDPLQAASAAQANEFLRLLVDGERDSAYETLREIEAHGEGAEPFLRRVLTAVESALNARMNNGTCDLATMDVLGSCDTPVLEQLARALTDGKHGGKLALTRAFNALK
jgi:hypothetical protein